MIAFAILLGTSSVGAESVSTKIEGFYLGAGFGDVSGEYNSIDMKMQDSSMRVIAGYQFNRWLASEIQYIKYGEDEFSIVDPTAFTWTTNLGYTFDMGLRPFVLLGFGIVNLNDSSGHFESDSGGSFHFGFGVDYALPILPNVAFRFAYEADGLTIQECTTGGYFPGCTDKNMEFGSAYAGINYKF